MNVSKEELLSALFDDEAGDFERRRLLDELKKDDELGQTLSRYAFIGEAMRAGQGQRLSSGKSLLSRIQAELDDEPAFEASNVVPMPTRPAAHPAPAAVVKQVQTFRWMAMAATLAAVAMGAALFLQQPQQPSLQTAAALPAVAPSSIAVAEVASVDERIQQLGQVNPQTRDMLKQYVAQHVKYASTTVIAPSIRAVSYANEN